MIKGFGIDLIEIDRIKEAVGKYGDSFLKKVFTPREIKYCRTKKALKHPELAVRFAAKEAYAKALGTGMAGISWKDIEVRNDKLGKPLLYYKEKLIKKAHLSLSHTHKYAVASVVLE